MCFLQMLLKIKDIILYFQTTKIKVLPTYLRRRYIWITPCKRSAARGRRIPTLVANSVGVQPATGLKGCGAPIYPELRFACTGLSMFIPFGDRKEQVFIKINLRKRIYKMDLLILLYTNRYNFNISRCSLFNNKLERGAKH